MHQRLLLAANLSTVTYPFAILVSEAVMNGFEHRRGATKDFVDMMRKGRSHQTVEQLLRPFGDITRPAFWQFGMDRLAEDVKWLQKEFASA